MKEFLHYTRSERNGLLVLTVICLALIISPSIFRQFFIKKGKTDFQQFQSQIDSFDQQKDQKYTSAQQAQLFPFNPNEASKEDFQKLGLSGKVASIIENYRNKGGKFYKKEDLKKIYGIRDTDYERLKDYIVLEDIHQKNEIKGSHFEEEVIVELFEFDPNTISREDLKRLGLSKKAINIMINYRKKGGTFRKREDLSKIYGITEEDFERLFSYIKIAEKKPTKYLANNEYAEIPTSYENTKRLKVDENIISLKIKINTSSPEEWQQLYGIGPYYAKMICGFRDKLGGFVSIDQVAQTYGLPDSTFQKIKPHLLLNESVKKIDLNTASAKELAAHPYLKWNHANAIVKYREQHGDFANVGQLANIKILNPGVLSQIESYLKIE